MSELKISCALPCLVFLCPLLSLLDCGSSLALWGTWSGALRLQLPPWGVCEPEKELHWPEAMKRLVGHIQWCELFSQPLERLRHEII